MTDKKDTVVWDINGELDDVSIHDVELFRMERMSDGCFWIRCYCKGKPDIVFNLGSQTKILGTYEYD